MSVDFRPLIHEPWSSCVILGPAAGARLPALARRLEVLNAMRVPGGKTISEESWQAILNTEVRTSSDEEPQSDPRLRAARG